MVLAESMRLFPPAWAMGRKAIKDFDLGPYRLPAKTTVLMSQYVTHREEKFFPDPLRFDPERFSPAAKAQRPKFAYFPFGAGGRHTNWRVVRLDGMCFGARNSGTKMEAAIGSRT